MQSFRSLENVILKNSYFRSINKEKIDSILCQKVQENNLLFVISSLGFFAMVMLYK